MHGSRAGDGGREDGASQVPPTPPSSRVQLEVAFLDAHYEAPALVVPIDERARLTVLVVAAEADFRRYVRECLRERVDLLHIEAATAVAAVALAESFSPDILVVDEPEKDVVETLAHLKAILIVDDVPHGTSRSTARVRMLGRPFAAEGLMAEVASLLR